MKSIKFMLIALAISFSSSVFSELVTPKGVGCDTVSGECFILLTEPFKETTCGGKTQVRFDPSQKGTVALYSTALAAHMADKQLEVVSTGCFKDTVTPAYLYVTN